MASIDIIDGNGADLQETSGVLLAAGHNVRSFTGGDIFLATHRSLPSDLVVLELSGFSPDGMSLLQSLRQGEDRGVSVVFYVSGATELDELFALRMGADDFLRKYVAPQILVARIGAILRRCITGLSVKKEEVRVLERGHLRMDLDRQMCFWKTKPVSLTVTEFLIVHSMAQRPGVVKSRDSLLDVAYGNQVYVDDRTIDSHIKRVRQKFRRVDKEFSALETLYGAGYRFKEGSFS